jgi:RNA polymerase sigma factor (sigma-70 family)
MRGPGLHLAKGPEGAWGRLEDLYRSSRDDVYAYVSTLLRDRSAAEDVTELTFERAYARWRTFDRRRGDERSWLFGIARNAAIDELRRRRRVVSLADEPRAEPVATALDGAEYEAEGAEQVVLRRSVVRAALAELPGYDRDLIALKFSAGLRNAEIARVLGVSESNAGTRLYRAVEKLRRAVNVTV